MNRRRFLALTAATIPAMKSLAEVVPPSATLTLHADQPGPTVPPNFIGLSYEIKQIADPAFFSPGNTGLIAQFRSLSTNGVLRLGGNTSDLGWWKPTPASNQPPLPANVVIQTPPGEKKSPLDLTYAVTPEAVVNLRGFLDATGWTCLYGMNLGTSTPDRAAEEAVFVAKTLGAKLEYFQLGNEADGFPNRFRIRATWTPDAYLDEWLAAANAVRARVPSARFGIPDVSEKVDWLAPIADRLLAMSNYPDVAAVTHHYYLTGPPSNPNATLDNLLKPNPRVVDDARLVRSAAERLHTKYRMTEGNTCYRGGKPGFSDVFGAALWAADYALTLASLGYAGVNLHGGGGKAVADSLGGALDGELLMSDPKASHPRPFYTPIADIDGSYVAEPVFHGLKFAGALAGATFLKLDFDPASGPAPVNATAFAARLTSGQHAIAIINKDATQPLSIHLPGYRVALTLTAASLSATQVELTMPSASRAASIVPPASAMLFHSTGRS